MSFNLQLEAITLCLVNLICSTLLEFSIITHWEADYPIFSLHSTSGMCIYIVVYVDDIVVVKCISTYGLGLSPYNIFVQSIYNIFLNCTQTHKDSSTWISILYSPGFLEPSESFPSWWTYCSSMQFFSEKCVSHLFLVFSSCHQLISRVFGSTFFVHNLSIELHKLWTQSHKCLFRLPYLKKGINVSYPPFVAIWS